MKKLFLLIAFVPILSFSQIDTINNGTAPGAGNGEILYSAFHKCNQTIDTVNKYNAEWRELPYGPDSVLASSTDTMNLVGDTLEAGTVHGRYKTLEGDSVKFGDLWVKKSSFNPDSVIASSTDTITLTLDTLQGGTVHSEFKTSEADSFLIKGNGWINESIFNPDSVLASSSDTLTIELDTARGPTLNYITKTIQINDSLRIGIDTLWIKETTNTPTYDIINFDPYTDTSNLEGNFYYDTLTRGLVLVDPDNEKWNVSSEICERAFNATGSQINRGDIVRLTGDTLINSYYYPLIELAGNSSEDSTKNLGAAAVDISSGGFGRVSALGRIDGLNINSSTGDQYLGNAGARIDTSPPPPAYSVYLGPVLTNDNDSGAFYFNPRDPTFDPSPKFSSDTSDLNETVTISTVNVYEYIPVGNSEIFSNSGFTVAGDSLQVQVAGDYQTELSMSFQGNPSLETWNYGLFINDNLQYKKTRSTSTNQAGDVNVSVERYFEVGDWISYRIRNTTGAGDPTIVDLAVQILFLNE